MKALLVPGPENMLMMVAEDVELPGVVVKKLEADVGQVVFGGLLSSDPDETKLLGVHSQ